MKCCYLERCKVLGILLIFLCFSLSAGQLSCYFGRINDTKNDASNQSFTQQTCVENHLTASTELHNSLTDVRNASSYRTKFCLVFMHRTSSHSVYTCDYEGICGTEGVHQQLRYEGEAGLAWCCTQNHCNSPETAKEVTLQSFNSTCYTKSDVSCEKEFLCLNRSTFASNGTVVQVEYGCENGTNGKEGCLETSFSGGRVVTCICSGHHCNHPEEIYNTLVASETVFPLASMTNPFYAERQSERSMNFIAASVGVSALVVFFFILIGIGIKKFREHRTQHLTYTYTQLTADLAEERDTDDEYMLIG